MNELAPTRQQRDIIGNLTKTLDTFNPAQSPYAENVAPQAPPGRRKNPRALIVAAGRVRPDPSQVRQKDRDPSSPRIQELARSIQQVGLQHPIGVREAEDGSYTIVYGEGRFIAMTAVLGLPEIEVLRVDAKDADLLWLQLHENIHRTNLDPLDLSAAIAQARDRGYTLAQIAQQMGKSEAWVQKSLTIATRLDEEARSVLQSAEQRPAMDSVYAIAQAPAETQSELARRVASESLTRRETQALADAARLTSPSAEPPLRSGRPRSFRSFETTLRAANGASVTVKFRKGDVTRAEIIAALEDVLKTLRETVVA
ncbi:MAG TPA: ParB/RepB/Spo0J family partition protein [Gemmataceae bacterium]|nr:ParB/RepB/Spo0J family partition protein [Gemmataceae bacterium]